MGIRQLMQNKVIAAIVMVYGSFALVLLGYGLYPEGTLAETGANAEFIVENLDEEEAPISLKNYKGKHLLVYFFSSW